MNPPNPTPRPLSPSEERAFEALDQRFREASSPPSTTFSLGYEFRLYLRRCGCPAEVLTRLNVGSATREDMALSAQLLRRAYPHLADQVIEMLPPRVSEAETRGNSERVFLARTMREKIDAMEAQVAELERAVAIGQRLVDEHEETITRQAERLEALADSDAVALQCDLIRGQHPDSTVWVTYTTDTALDDVGTGEPARWSVVIARGAVRVCRTGTTLREAAGRATVSMQVAATKERKAAGRRQEDA